MDRAHLMYLKTVGRFPFKAGNSVKVKYADETALCEFALPEDFHHEWMFSKGSVIWKAQML